MEFGILPCSQCKKTPSVNKDLSYEDENRYTISHCGITAKGLTETQAIVNWNAINKVEEENNEQRDEERTTP